MTSQPVEQRGDFKEWNYTETHLPVRRVDEHNACVAALREALAREVGAKVENGEIKLILESQDLRLHEAVADAARLREAVAQAAAWFGEYADNHAVEAKFEKAQRNRDRQNACLAALGQEESK